MTNPYINTELSSIPPRGRLLAVDPGTKRVGLAVSDELQTIARPLPLIVRSSWKKLLSAISDRVSEFDAGALVIGLPLNFEGGKNEMLDTAEDMARKFGLSLKIPVFTQDERMTSYEAKGRIWARGSSLQDTKALVDSEAAVIILSDFLSRLHSSRSTVNPNITA